jgi:hypothetical protein
MELSLVLIDTGCGSKGKKVANRLDVGKSQSLFQSLYTFKQAIARHHT